MTSATTVSPSPASAPGGSGRSWPARWEARWIWFRHPTVVDRLTTERDEEDLLDTFAVFRREVTLDSLPATVLARVVADGRYVLWVNGVEASRGPVRSEPGVLLWDEVDLRPQLQPGLNVVAVTVRHYGRAVPWWSPAAPYEELGRGGLALECRDWPGFSTDNRWSGRRGPWQPRVHRLVGVPNEDFDARGIEERWLLPGFDDSAWARAVELEDRGRPAALPGTPFTLMLPNPLPPMCDIRREARVIARGRRRGDLEPPHWDWLPVDPLYRAGGRHEVRPGESSWPVALQAAEGVLVDFGGMTLGVPMVDLEVEAATEIVLRASEILQDGNIDDRDRQWAHRHVARTGRQVVQPFDSTGLRYLHISSSGSAVIHDVHLRERRYPLPRDGRFECDDPDVEAIWEIGARTLELCSTDAVIDCPGREQRAWLGDAIVSGAVSYVVSGDTRLPVHRLRLAAQGHRPDGLLSMVAAGDYSRSPETNPDASLQWISSLAQAYLYTGDLRLAQELLPRATSILDWFWAFVDEGLLQAVPGWVFVDWVPANRNVPTASMQGLLLVALQDHATLAGAVGWTDAAAQSEARAQQLRQGFARFFDAARGVYVEELGAPIATQHAAAMAVIAGAVTGEKAARTIEAAVNPVLVRYPVTRGAPWAWDYSDDFDPLLHVLAAQPFFAHFLHRAMAVVGRRDLVLESIKRWQQFIAAGDGAVWEFWVDQGHDFSHAHAFSATPTFDLSTYILGVAPALPGYSTVSVRPYLGTLRRVAGTVPTPRGPVSLELERRAHGLTGRVTLPEGSTGVLELEEWPAAGARPLGAGHNDVAT